MHNIIKKRSLTYCYNKSNLGGTLMTSTISTGSANQITSPGVYVVGANVTETPSQRQYIFFCYGRSGDFIQVAARISTSEFYVRTKDSDTWSQWSTLGLNMPSFYKNYNSLAELKAALETI